MCVFMVGDVHIYIVHIVHGVFKKKKKEKPQDCYSILPSIKEIC